MSDDHAYHLLFVCTANICRSPMAEGLAKAYARTRRWPLHVRSGGVMGLIGRPAEPQAVRALAQIGVDISRHRSQGVTAEDVAWADYILVMEMNHQMKLRQKFPQADGKLMLLGTFGGTIEIEDPMGGWRWRFRRTRDLLRRCVESFIDQLPPPVTEESP